jgi:hypothetical protein
MPSKYANINYQQREMNMDFQTALDNFMTAIRKITDETVNADWQKRTVKDYSTLSLDEGKRYIRIVATNGGQSSSYGFIDKTNGDILKAASWKAPCKEFCPWQYLST